MGDVSVLADIIERLNLKASINSIQDIKEAKFVFGNIDVFDLHNVKISEPRHGEVQKNCWLKAGNSISNY